MKNVMLMFADPSHGFRACLPMCDAKTLKYNIVTTCSPRRLPHTLDLNGHSNTRSHTFVHICFLPHASCTRRTEMPSSCGGGKYGIVVCCCEVIVKRTVGFWRDVYGVQWLHTTKATPYHTLLLNGLDIDPLEPHAQFRYSYSFPSSSIMFNRHEDNACCQCMHESFFKSIYRLWFMHFLAFD